MPELAAMIATVALVTQFVKDFITKSKLNLVIEGTAAVVLSILVSIAVVAYYHVSTSTPFTVASIILLVQVGGGAIAGYSLLKVARNPN